MNYSQVQYELFTSFIIHEFNSHKRHAIMIIECPEQLLEDTSYPSIMDTHRISNITHIHVVATPEA